LLAVAADLDSSPILDIAALEAVNVQMAAYELEQDDPPERVQATALASANTRP
jgi:hypothetical protein